MFYSLLTMLENEKLDVDPKDRVTDFFKIELERGIRS